MGRDHTLFALEPGYVRYYTQKRPQKSWSRNRVWRYCECTSFLGSLSRPTANGESFISGAIALTPNEPIPRPEADMGRSRRFGLVELGKWKAIYQEGKIPEGEEATPLPSA
jgi:hypothetical protein